MAHRGAGEIRADVTVTGDAVGQLARGRTRPDAGRPGAGQRRHRPPPGAAPASSPALAPSAASPPGPAGRSSAATTRSSRCCAELAAYGSVALQAPPGMGADDGSAAPRPPPRLAAAYGAVVCLSAPGPVPRRPPPGPLHHVLTTDVPMRPTLEQLRELLRPARAAVLLDDVELSAADVAELQYLLPNCGFVFAGRNVGGVMRSVKLTGSRSTRRASCSRTSSASRWSAAWCTRCGASPAARPRPLVQLGVTASTYPDGRVRRQSALNEGPPPFAVDTPQDRRLLGLLARRARRRALRGAAHGRLRRARRGRAAAPVGRTAGWWRRPPPARTASRAASSTRPSGDWRNAARSWSRRSRRGRGATRTPCSSRVGRRSRCGCCRRWPARRQAWRAVLALGAVLDVAYAAAGRWDAWHSCLQATLEAARALGDQAAEAMALHQLGTGALCRGDLAAAHDLLSRALEHARGARPHRGRRGHPAEPGDDHRRPARRPASRRGLRSARIPTPVKAVAVLLPLLGSLAFVGLGAGRGDAVGARSDPQRLAFVDQVVDKASAPQVFRLTNDGPTDAARRQRRRQRGRTTARSRSSTRAASARCPTGGGCTATVVFTPATPGRAAGQPVLAHPGDPGRPHRADRRHGRGGTAAAGAGGRGPVRARVQRAGPGHAQRAAAGPRRRRVHAAAAQGGRRAGRLPGRRRRLRGRRARAQYGVRRGRAVHAERGGGAHRAAHRGRRRRPSGGQRVAARHRSPRRSSPTRP